MQRVRRVLPEEFRYVLKSFCAPLPTTRRKDMRPLAQRIGMWLLACTLGDARVWAQGWQHIGNVQHVEKLADGVELSAGTAKVRITAFRSGIFRVRLAPDGHFAKDFSWAVIEPPDLPTAEVEESNKELRLIAGDTVATVEKSPLLINFSDPSGNVLLADEPSLPMAWNGPRVHVWKKMPAEENYYGLGRHFLPNMHARAVPCHGQAGVVGQQDVSGGVREINQQRGFFDSGDRVARN